MSASPAYLVADIGGTNARFAIARVDRRRGISLARVRRFKNADFDEPSEAARIYLEGFDGEPPTRGCVAVAAHVTSGEVRLTNSHWVLRPDELAQVLGLETLTVVNDFAAQARGAPLAPDSDRAPIHESPPDPRAPCAVLGPGTGLGLGLLVPHDAGPLVVPTEGGHAGFAPRTEEERAVARRLEESHGFVSWEHLLSGAGLVHIHQALCELDGRSRPEHRPEDITEEALADAAGMARRVVDFFCAALGSFAGDVAVMSGALGGVYLGGGILPRIRSILEASEFVERFTEHGVMTSYASAIPVWLVLSDTAPLLGAAALAEQARTYEGSR